MSFIARRFAGRLENQPNLSIFQQSVDGLVLDGERIAGVVTQLGIRFSARAIVLTAGTFLGGRAHVGSAKFRQAELVIRPL